MKIDFDWLIYNTEIFRRNSRKQCYFFSAPLLHFYQLEIENSAMHRKFRPVENRLKLTLKEKKRNEFFFLSHEIH